jgi:hypothetical protein
MKMGGRLRCSSVTYRFDMRPPRSLPATHFDRNERYAYFGDRTLAAFVTDFAFKTLSGTKPRLWLLRKARRWSASHEFTIQLLAFLGGLPAVVTGLFFLWSEAVSTPARWTLSVLIVGAWFGCVLILRGRVVFPIQTLTNLIDALREGDYSVRSRRGRESGALGEVMAAVNGLGETLLLGRQRATEATALLRAAMAEINFAVFVFDGKGCLRLINRAGVALLGHPENDLLYRHASQIGLEECLEGEGIRTVSRQFFGSGSSRWGLRRIGFRESGYPYQLLILVDLGTDFRKAR